MSFDSTRRLHPIRQNPILSGCCVPTGTVTVSSLSHSNFCFPSHFRTIECVAALPLLWTELLHQKQCCRECGSMGLQTVVLTEADGESKSISRMRSCSSGMMPRMNLCLFHYNQAAVIWLACLPGNSATLGAHGCLCWPVNSRIIHLCLGQRKVILLNKQCGGRAEKLTSIHLPCNFARLVISRLPAVALLCGHWQETQVSSVSAHPGTFIHVPLLQPPLPTPSMSLIIQPPMSDSPGIRVDPYFWPFLIPDKVDKNCNAHWEAWPSLLCFRATRVGL